MNDLVMERIFPCDPSMVFDHISRPELVLQWWGPEGVSVPEHQLDFRNPGPWTSTMVNAEGGRYKVSGEIIAVDPPRSLEMTWAWHDDEDRRGHESRVRFEVESTKDGTMFRLIQTGLADEESVSGHDQGWTSSFRKLERMLA